MSDAPPRGEPGGVPTGESGLAGSSPAPKLLTKNPSPDFPNFISISVLSPFTVMNTFLSVACKTLLTPKLTWNGDPSNVPSGCSITTTSIAELVGV